MAGQDARHKVEGLAVEDDYDNQPSIVEPIGRTDATRTSANKCRARGDADMSHQSLMATMLRRGLARDPWLALVAAAAVATPT